MRASRAIQGLGGSSRAGSGGCLSGFGMGPLSDGQIPPASGNGKEALPFDGLL